MLLLAQIIPVAPARADIALVHKALDGDSLLLADGRQVRLIGINAPEFGKDGAPDEPLARAARDRAMALAGGQRLRLIDGEERTDRYGRTLAYAILPDGRDLQELLLREGLAWFIAIPPNVAHLASYRAAEAQAQAARRGIWAQPEYAPLPVERVSAKRTGFMRIEGTVTGIESRRHTVEVQLSPTVKLLMSQAVFTSLDRAGPALNGKRVLARGWLAEYKEGLRMRITHAAMLEVSP